MTGAPSFDTVAIVGFGMMGASLALALREAGLAKTVIAVDIRDDHRRTAIAKGLADSAEADPARAAAHADLVVLATPIGRFGDIARAIGPHLKSGAIVTDLGSTKGSVLADVLPHMPEGVAFVPGHPLAGSEKSGPENAIRGLFRERWAILTPTPETDPDALARLRAMWEALGAMVDIMDAAHHDRVLAIVSHLPHLIAYSIVGTADDLEDATKQEVIRYSASGFRDFTRLAGSDPEMWRDIFLANKDAILEILQRFQEDLTALQRNIRWSEGERLEALFRRTREIRQSVIEARQAYDRFEPPDEAGDREEPGEKTARAARPVTPGE